MRRYLSIILIFTHTSILFADTLTFINGGEIEGELLKLKTEDDSAGAEIVFQVDKFSMTNVLQNAIVEKLDDNTFVFNQDYVYKIIDDKGGILFGSKNLKANRNYSREVVEGIGKEAGQYLVTKGLMILLAPILFMAMIWVLSLLGWSPGG